eukprot:1175969-Prorocentrum_minimum.AAC.5
MTLHNEDPLALQNGFADHRILGWQRCRTINQVDNLDVRELAYQAVLRKDVVPSACLCVRPHLKRVASLATRQTFAKVRHIIVRLVASRTLCARHGAIVPGLSPRRFPLQQLTCSILGALLSNLQAVTQVRHQLRSTALSQQLRQGHRRRRAHGYTPQARRVRDVPPERAKCGWQPRQGIPAPCTSRLSRGRLRYISASPATLCASSLVNVAADELASSGVQI